MGILQLPPPGAGSLRDTGHASDRRQAEAATRRWQERYVKWRQETLTQLRAALPAEELVALEAAHQARLVAEGTRRMPWDWRYAWRSTRCSKHARACRLWPGLAGCCPRAA